VADILQFVVDMAGDARLDRRGGASISKAVDLLEAEHALPSHAPLRSAWSEFRDVAHLIAAGAFLAKEGQPTGAPYAGSIFTATWLAPDAVLALASGYQEFSLQFKAHGLKMPVLPIDSLWRIPNKADLLAPFLLRRRLSDAQITLLMERRAR
jgi:hypothetical protein